MARASIQQSVRSPLAFDALRRIICAAVVLVCAWPATIRAQAEATPRQPSPPDAGAPSPAPAPRSPDDTAPRVLHRVEPTYPSRLLTEPHGPHDPLPELDVELEVRLDDTGKIISIKVLTSGGPDFDAEAVRAVSTWVFAPALRGGKPVVSRFHVPVHFEPPPHPEPPPPKPGEVSVKGRKPPPTRGASDYRIEVGALGIVPRQSAGELLKLAPSVFLLKDGGGEGHAERVYLRGFDAREGQDIEFSVDGVPINESGNYHGNGLSDLNFMIPELVSGLRVLEGPFDPRQGNYAVAGSADYRLGLDRRGLTAKATYGSFNTTRLLLLWGPEGESNHTYGGVEIYRSEGFGENRDAWRARAMGQYEGRLGEEGSFRIATAAYATQYHSAGLLRESDVASGKKDFSGTYDPNQGGSAARFHLMGDMESKAGDIVFYQQLYAIYKSQRSRENFTGFLLDVQEARQQPHGQRGDLLDLAQTAGTFGARGSGRMALEVLEQPQEIELGYFARGDLTSAVQQRVGAATDTPYVTEADLDSKLADIGLHADLTVRFAKWAALRGGLRADLFGYDVEDNCAVKDASRPEDQGSDESCLSQQRFGEHREKNQRSSTATIRAMPRASVLLGPFEGFSFSLAYGQGVRAIDPSFVSQDVETPFAAIDAGEIGTSYAKSFDAVSVSAQSVFFVTHVDRDQIFSETEGRNVLGTGTTRAGWSGSVRLRGDFFDTSESVTLVQSRFDDTGLLVPYVPDVVVRSDSALFGDFPWDIDGSPLTGRLGLGMTLVGQRALPFGQRSDLIFTMDSAAALGWRFLELEVAVTNMLNLEYRQAEYNFVSDFEPSNPATLVPARHFAAGQPIGAFVSLSGTLGGSS